MRTAKLCMCISIFLFVIVGVNLYAFAEEYDGYIVKFSSPPVMPLSEDNIIEPVLPERNLFKLNTEDTEYLDYLKNSSDVEFIEPDYVISIPEGEDVFSEQDMSSEQETFPGELSDYFVTASAAAGFDIPNDFRYGNQWNMPMINVPYLWKNGISAESVKIGIIDSGNPSRHPDVNINVEEGRDYTGIGSVYDIFGHSTFICGLIASELNNCIGTAGILSDCTIVPLRILSDTRDTTTSVLYKALYDAIYVYECDVINMSLSFDIDIQSIKQLVNEAVNRGIILVAAAGNSGDAGILYPAGYDGVIGVASVNRNKVRYSSSQRNTSVDISAPGVSLYSTYVTRSKSGSDTLLNYSYYSGGTGTSYAAPHVSAAAAVAKLYDPHMTSDEFLGVLAETSEHLGSEGKNIEYGYGLIDMQKIAEEMQSRISSSDAEPIADETLDFDSQPTAAEVIEPQIFIAGFEPKLTVSSGLEVNRISANVTVKNNLHNIKAAIVMALYDESNDDNELEDRLCGVSSINADCYTGANGSTFTLDAIYIPPDCKRPYVKVFVWDENFSPLTDTFTYYIKR